MNGINLIQKFVALAIIIYFPIIVKIYKTFWKEIYNINDPLEIKM